MNGTGRDNDSSRPIDSLDSFEHLEGNMNSQSGGEYEPDFPFDVLPPEFQATESGFFQDDLEEPGIIHEERLTNESLGGDIIHFDDEHETSGLLNESELLNHREHQYDSGSNCPSEDSFHNDCDRLGEGSSTDLLQRYMEATPRADTSLPELNYASDGLDDGPFGYSDDVFDHHEHFYNNNNEQYMEGIPPEKSDQIRNYRGRNMSNGINGGDRTPIDSIELSDGDSAELNDTIVAANGLRAGTHPAVADVENYGDEPPDSKDSDSTSMSIGQFVPNAVNRNRLPRPMGKLTKRSTPKNNETELLPPNELQQGSVGSRSARSSARNSPRFSAIGSHRSHNSPRYSQRSEDLSDLSRHRHPRGPATSDIRQRPNGVPQLDLRRTSTDSSVNLSQLSNPSKLDLSLRLQAESKTRQHADELIDQLQKNYDELLGKYAQAENTIDHLKLGARVNLYGDSPAPGQSFRGTLSPSQKPGIVNIAQPQKATVHHIVSSSSHISGGQVGGQPSDQTGHSTMGMQTNNNNVLRPAGTRPSETARTSDSGFPAGEGILMALAFQVKSQQEQIDSFGALLQENQLSPSEQKVVLDRLRADQGKLESDYMHAKEEHNALRRRNSLLNGGADVTFDPDRQLEGEIFQLGMKLEDVAEIVQNNLRNNPPTTLSPPHRNQPQELDNGDNELQEQLRQELERRFQNSRQTEDGNNYTRGEDEKDDPGVEHYEPHLSFHSGNSLLPSESSEAECHSQDNDPSFSPPKAFRPPQTNGKERNSRNKISTDVANGQRRSKQSQLPRSKSFTNKSPSHDQHGPPGTRQHPVDPRGNAPRQKPPENGFMSPEADSGFMGSESSRQSNHNGGFSGYDGRNQLKNPRERYSLRSSKLPVGQRSPPQVNRRLPGDWESPQFSDYDISERDEDVEEVSTQSGGVGKRKPVSVEKTPVAKSTLQVNRRSADKPKQRVTTVPSNRLQPSGLRLPAEKQQRDHAREPQHTHERQRNPESRGTGSKSSKDPSTAWNDYRGTSGTYPEPSSNYRQLPKQSRDIPHSRNHNSPKEVTRLGVDPARGNRPKDEFDVLGQKPRMVSEQQRGYDSGSDFTRSSGKSEAIRGLQGEIEQLKRQMAKMNSPEEVQRRSPTKEEPHHPRSGLRRSRLDSVRSEAGSSRSETLRALQNEIDDLRNQVNEQDVSPILYGSPLSRGSLREPLRDDSRDRSHFDSPPPRDKLRETLRQTYIPQSIPREHSFTRTPPQSFLSSNSPYQSRARNPAPQFESTPFVRSPPYIPTFPESPSPTRKSYHPSSFLSSRVRVPPDSGVTPSPIYTSRLEPCPMCSGSGVHTHGEYSYPRDLQRLSTINPPGTVESAPHGSNAHTGQYGPTPNPFSTNQTQAVFSPNPSQGHMQASVGTSLSQAPYSNQGQQPTLNPTQQTAQSPQPVFNHQSSSNPVLNQPQPALHQPQLINQPQPALHQPQPALHQPQLINQPQPVLQQPQQVFSNPQPTLNQPHPVYTQPQQVYTQPQPVLNQPQLVLSQPQPVSNNPQPVANPPAHASVNQGLNQATPMQTPNAVQAHTIFTPVGNYVPLVTIPVYTGIPVNATPQGTSEKQRKKRSERKPKKSTDSQKPTRGHQDTGGTTIYITPTKRRGRYYVLDDEEAQSTGMEEYYYRRTPRQGSHAKESSFLRKSKDSKYAHSSSMDLNEAIKMADQLNRSSHRMLESVRSDVSQSQFL